MDRLLFSERRKKKVRREAPSHMPCSHFSFWPPHSMTSKQAQDTWRRRRSVCPCVAERKGGGSRRQGRVTSVLARSVDPNCMHGELRTKNTVPSPPSLLPFLLSSPPPTSGGLTDCMQHGERERERPPSSFSFSKSLLLHGHRDCGSG